MKSAALPPPLPSRTGSKPVPPYPAPKPPLCKKCGTDDPCSHAYDDIVPKRMSTDTEGGQYEQLVTPEDATNNQITTRLRNIEDNQMRLRNEFNDFRESIEQSIRSLHSSIKSVMEMSESLDESMRESFEFVRSNMDKAHQQLMENSDHLGKQMLDVRRDIQVISTHQPMSVRPGQQRKKYTHLLEWEMGDIDSLMKHQQSTSSQSYLIGQLDFKVIGGAVCTRDGYLRVKIYGEFTHMLTEPRQRKNGNFDCSAFLVDMSGKHADMLVGKVTGDFNTGKEWVVGNVSAAEIKVHGYTTRDGNVNVKFVINVYI